MFAAAASPPSFLRPFRSFAQCLLRSSSVSRSANISYFPIKPPPFNFVISAEVQNALRDGKAIVALESTLITHGLPHPTNLNVAIRLEQIVREENAVPATIALLDGNIRIGLSRDELKRLSKPAEGNALKVSRRDLANCLVEKRIGGTTVAATMWIAHLAGIRIFATGGIGGVHRGDILDVSADLTELGRTPIGVVCAGVKSILDIERTLEYLETQSVCVVVLDKSPNFPGFFGPRTSFKAPYHTNSLEKVADILLLSNRMGLPNGTLIACPMPEDQRMDRERDLIMKETELALKEADKEAIRGKEVTPFVLHRIRQSQSAGAAATELNIALLENNVRIGARLALVCSNKMTSAKSATNNEQKKFEKDTSKKRPKIMVQFHVCVGASIVDVAVFHDKCSPSVVGAYVPSRIVQSPGGVARNHADALSRLGCDVTLISALGTERRHKERRQGEQQQLQKWEVDLFGRFLMERCEHIDWSHVCHCPDTPTASSVGICLKGTVISQGFISVEPIMEQMDDKYIQSKEEQITNAEFVLVDANLNERTLRKVIELAQNNDTRVWFEPTNWTKVSKLFETFGPNALHKINVISPNMDELEEMAKHLDDGACRRFVRELKAFLNSLSSSSTPKEQFPSLINEWISQNPTPSVLFPPSMDHLLITCDSMGVLLLSHSTDSSSIFAHFAPPPNVPADQIESVSGAGDCFNSGFLSAFLSGCSLEKSMELATKCASISMRSAETVPEMIGQ